MPYVKHGSRIPRVSNIRRAKTATRRVTGRVAARTAKPLDWSEDWVKFAALKRGGKK